MAILNVAMAIALTLQAAVAPTPLAPSSKWVMSYEESSCVLAREFGIGDDKVTLAITPAVIGGGAELAIVKADQGKPFLVETKGPLTIDTTVAEHTFGTFVAPKANVRITRTYLDEADIEALARAKLMSLPITKGRIVSLAPSGMAKALKAADTCRREFQAKWGIDTTALASIVEPAASSGVADWITTADYPTAALRSGNSGTVTILWTVGTDGKVQDCRTIRSSGSTLLDDAACKAITKRGRYSPAKNAAGQPVISWGSRRVRWNLPGF